MRPWKRISINFKGPLEGKNQYLHFAINELSRYPLAFPSHDITTATVIQWLSQLFCLFSLPFCVHSDRGTSFMSEKLTHYLSDRGVATCRSSPYYLTYGQLSSRKNEPNSLENHTIDFT